MNPPTSTPPDKTPAPLSARVMGYLSLGFLAAAPWLPDGRWVEAVITGSVLGVAGFLILMIDRGKPPQT